MPPDNSSNEIMPGMVVDNTGVTHPGHSTDPIKDRVIHYLTNSQLHGQHMIEFAVIILAVTSVSVGILIRKNVLLKRLLKKLKILDQAKSHFIAVAAHQLRTPLSGIKWTLDLILKNNFGELAPKQREYLQLAFETQEKLIVLVNDLLDVSIMEQGGWDFNFKPEEIVSLVSESVGNFKMEADNRNVKLSFNYPENLKINLIIDRVKIKVVVDNLISNALKYTPSGGKVDVILKDDEKNFEISVADSGIGIPPEEQEEIFSKFHRLSAATKMSPNGSGLGLFIARSIALRHGGELRVKSEVEHGSSFTLVLPKKFDQNLIAQK